MVGGGVNEKARTKLKFMRGKLLNELIITLFALWFSYISCTAKVVARIAKSEYFAQS
jgi:hypothetical protein